MRVLHDKTNVTGQYNVLIVQRLARGVEMEYLAVVESLGANHHVVWQDVYPRESLALSVAWAIVDDLLLESRARAEQATIPADTGGT